MVKALLEWTVLIPSQVPLACKKGTVSPFLQHLGIGGHLQGQPVARKQQGGIPPPDIKLISMSPARYMPVKTQPCRVLAGVKAGPRGTAGRGGNIGIFKDHPFGCKAVYRRGMEIRVPEADIIVAQVVHEQDDNIGDRGIMPALATTAGQQEGYQ
jgi:hypothetical protein